jgi:predicted phosphate transport protein (TIGR00153 family)
MIRRLLPREEKFFEHFRQSADLILEGANVFHEMLLDLGNSEAHAKRIQEIEGKADKVAHHIIELLHKTFITPLDREEIHQLISRMDDIIDYIEAASERIYLYKITIVTEQMLAMSQICVKSCEHIRAIMNRLEDMKDTREMLSKCVEINRLENEADQLLRISLAKLFDEEENIKNLLKMKEIYELLETVTDRCEDVSNIVEGIVLEHS